MRRQKARSFVSSVVGMCVVGVGFGGCKSLPDGSSSEPLGTATNGASDLDTSNGLSALNGLNGINGLNGSNGLNGINGLNTANGFTAQNGLNTANGLSSINGFTSQNGFNGVNGLNTANGFTSQNGFGSINGLNLGGGLATQNGIGAAAGLMTSDGGRKVVTYLVKCALPAGKTISKTVAGVTYQFPGLIGLAPMWETGACDRNCQEWVSACMISLVNTTGTHVPLWMVGRNPALGFGQNASYPYQEGSFFGNIFVSPPQAYYCAGRDFTVDPVPGRIGGVQTGAPYVDPWGASARCDAYCTAADRPFNLDGYKACYGVNNVVTIWRD